MATRTHVGDDLAEVPLPIGPRFSDVGSGPKEPLAPWIGALRGWLARTIVQDALIAAILTALGVIGVFAHLEVDLPEGGGPSLRHMDAIGIAFILLQTVPLIWRRVAPIAVLAVTGIATVAFFAFGYFLSFAAFGFLVALYTVASMEPRRVSVRVGIASGLVLLASTAFSREPFEVDALLAEILLVVGAWFLGDAVRIRRAQVVELEDLNRKLEHEREQLARAAVARERRLIARELHDVIAHNVSVIVMQSGAAQRVFDIDPDAARSSLRSIEGTAREAMGEMRRLTGFLRTDSETATEWTPQPGLADLPTLLDQVRDAGIEVSLRVEGEPRPIPASLDLSAYRIAQEALTNVIRHAGRARTRVVLVYGESSIELRVEDEGTGIPTPTRGARQPYGHLGMRERVALFGGSLRVGRRPRGGYEVHAILPFDGVVGTGTDVEPGRSDAAATIVDRDPRAEQPSRI